MGRGVTICVCNRLGATHPGDNEEEKAWEQARWRRWGLLFLSAPLYHVTGSHILRPRKWRIQYRPDLLMQGNSQSGFYHSMSGTFSPRSSSNHTALGVAASAGLASLYPSSLLDVLTW